MCLCVELRHSVFFLIWLKIFPLESFLQETRRNTLIKDGMREQCIPHLVESWFQILQTYQQSHPELTCQCLEVVGSYVSWIDLNLIANDRSVHLMMSAQLLFSRPQRRLNSFNLMILCKSKKLQTAERCFWIRFCQNFLFCGQLSWFWSLVVLKLISTVKRKKKTGCKDNKKF